MFTATLDLSVVHSFYRIFLFVYVFVFLFACFTTFVSFFSFFLWSFLSFYDIFVSFFALSIFLFQYFISSFILHMSFIYLTTSLYHYLYKLFNIFFNRTWIFCLGCDLFSSNPIENSGLEIMLLTCFSLLYSAVLSTSIPLLSPSYSHLFVVVVVTAGWNLPPSLRSYLVCFTSNKIMPDADHLVMHGVHSYSHVIYSNVRKN